MREIVKRETIEASVGVWWCAGGLGPLQRPSTESILVTLVGDALEEDGVYCKIHSL